MSNSMSLTQKIEAGIGLTGLAGTLVGIGTIVNAELTKPEIFAQDIANVAYLSLASCLVGIAGTVPESLRTKSRKLGIEIKDYKELVKEWWPVIKEHLPLYGMYEYNKNIRTKDRNVSETLRRLRFDGYDIVNDNYHCLVSIAPTFGAILYFIDKSGLIK